MDRLLVITDRKATRGRALEDVIAAALAGGARLIQLREKDLESRALYELAVRLRRVASDHGAKLLVNDRIDVALAADADGVVLPADSFPTSPARALLGRERLIGRSAHSPEEVAAALREGCDFALFGPVYETPSKASFGAPQGLERLRPATEAAAIPVFAVGGITASNAAAAISAGAAGVAVIRAVMKADDPARAVRELVAALG